MSTPSDHKAHHPCPKCSAIVLPGIPALQEEKNLEKQQKGVRCVSHCFPNALKRRQSREQVARSGAHLKCIKAQGRTILCNLAAPALLSAFLFAVRGTPLHVAAASQSD